MFSYNILFTNVDDFSGDFTGKLLSVITIPQGGEGEILLSIIGTARKEH